MGMTVTYDQWKTTDPREFDHAPEDVEEGEIEALHADLRVAQATIAFLRKRIADLEAKYEPEIEF